MTQWLQSIGRISGWTLLCLPLLAGNLHAELPQVSFEPVPAWVHEATWSVETNESASSKSAGTRRLLYEIQDRPKSSQEFVRVAELMENENGVQDSGSLRIGFEAEFQDLCLHRVVIHRDGQALNRLDPAKVRVIQPEYGLSGDVFTGHKTAVLFIEDLRVGDVLEYAYTVRGANPVLGGHYSRFFTIQAGTPVQHVSFRVVWDDKSALQNRSHLTSARPVVQPWQEGAEYTWDFSKLPAIPYEDYQPAEYEAYPYLEVSDFTNWSEVVNWALPLYQTIPTNMPAELQELIAGWQKSATSNEEKVRFALEFVQDKLRYTGIELGPDSYRPANPLDTFQKRYADCKGKVVLLHFLLQQMGFQSFPALVSASEHNSIEGRLPSPFNFDHVILKIQLDGRMVWVDPTCSNQGGMVGNRYVPPYGKALVVRPGNDNLEDVPRSRPESTSQHNVVSTFDITSYEQPVRFSVRTEYRGVSADDVRDQFAGTERTEIANNYLNYYSKSYSGIKSSRPLEITDHRLADVVTVEEFYTISNLWTRKNGKGLWVASFLADNLNNALTDPDTRLRKTPLSLIYPMSRRQQVIVHLPDKDWQISDTRTNIETPDFAFNYQRSFRDGTVTFEYDLRTKRVAVPAEQVASYLASSDHMRDLLSDTLQRPDKSASIGINWLMVVIAIFGSGATVAGCVGYWRTNVAHAQSIPPIPVATSQLQGLGGWLILLGFGLCLAPIIRVVAFGQNWESYFSNQVWQTVAMPQGNSYHPLYGPLLIYELLCNVLRLGLNLLALGLFFGKRRAFTRIFIALALFNAFFLIVDHIAAGMISSLQTSSHVQGQKDVIQAVFYAVIWISYVMKSQRVKATFIK